MVTSAILAARENGFSSEEQERIARVGAKSYKDMLHELLEIPALQRHYYSVDSTKLAETVREDSRKKIKRTAQKARMRWVSFGSGMTRRSSPTRRNVTNRRWWKCTSSTPNQPCRTLNICFHGSLFRTWRGALLASGL